MKKSKMAVSLIPRREVMKLVEDMAKYTGLAESHIWRVVGDHALDSLDDLLDDFNFLKSVSKVVRYEKV